MEITYLKHHQIDKQKWDTVIKNGQNGMVYALSWFLDISSPGWDALVTEDYTYVMPLTYKKKYGIKYLHQPSFSQQLGVFSKEFISDNITQEFIFVAQENFKFIDIQLNILNPVIESGCFILRNTQFIDLSKSYQELFENYTKNLKKNIQSLSTSNLKINNQGKSADFIDLMQKMFKKKQIHEIKQNDFIKLKHIIDYCLMNNWGEIFFGYLGDQLCASAFFLKWGNRVILYTALNEKGREVGAMFGLIDTYLKENAGQNMLFDFAGSNIKGVKYRNLGFGAQNEIYYKVKINNLPIPLKWLKK